MWWSAWSRHQTLIPVAGWRRRCSQERQGAEESFFGDAAAVDLDGRRGPDFPHVRLSPEFDALGPGLQDPHDDQALGALSG